MKEVQGGICAPKGFVAAGIYAGIRKNPNKKDLALIYSKTPCISAGVTTQNLSCAAPVLVTREHLENTTTHAIICNSGNANACAPNGVEIANEMCRLTADALGIQPEEVLVASTGVIGKPMDITPIKEGITPLTDQLSKQGGDDCACAIMTTDLTKKEIAIEFLLGEIKVTIGGIAKGSGMIHPNMATLLGFVTTDVGISKTLLQKAVIDATAETFNMVSVDGDTSTNDMVLVLANGLSGNKKIEIEDESYQIFYQGLLQVFKTLAIAVAADGEGASKLITSHVSGGSNQEQTRTLAKAIITSSLVKAAFFGEDANWGRILCAMGYSGADLQVEKVMITIVSSKGSIKVCENGQAYPFDEDIAAIVLSDAVIDIEVSVGDGIYEATAWGCDLTYDYVKINGDYRS